MKTMFIEWPDFNIKVEAKLEDVRNADLINEIWDNLPMTCVQEHAMVTGKSMYCWAPMVSIADIPFQMRIKDTPPGVVSYSQKTGNKLIVRYGKVTEDLMTPIVGFIDPAEVPQLEKVGEAVWNNYKLPGDQRKTYLVIFSKGRAE
jgi:hypothetical protein